MGWVPSGIGRQKGAYDYHSELNSLCYAAESPDAIEPVGEGAFTVMRYTENNLSAAVAYDGSDYKTFVMGVPFETVKTASDRVDLMAQILAFLCR